MLNEIFKRAKKVYKETNKVNNIGYTLFSVLGIIVFFIGVSMKISGVESYVDPSGKTVEAQRTIMLGLMGTTLFGGLLISEITKFKKFKEKLELKLIDKEKIAEFNKALAEIEGRIVFSKDYTIFFNEEIFETSQIDCIVPVLAKQKLATAGILEVYLKSDKTTPITLSMFLVKSFKIAKKQILKFEPAFEKLREANIPVEEITLKGYKSL